MSAKIYENGTVRKQWDDTSRTVTTYDETGKVTETRPYTAEENTDADAQSLAAEIVAAEQARAIEHEAILTAIAVTATSPPDGKAWTAPSGAHDAYALGATVTHQGKTWVSLTAFCVWEPGVSGWREVTGGYPAWVQPTGAHDAYEPGATVTHNGKTWRNDNPGANVWEPGATWALWTEMEDEA